MAASPIHVHVQDNTPVHVHVKKPKSAVIRQEEKPTHDFPNGSRRSLKATAKSRSKAINGPWIPAPGKTSLRDKNNQAFKWDSGKSYLEVNMPQSKEEKNSALQRADLSTDEEEKVHTHMRNYEKKIEELMNEVGSLRNESLPLFKELSESLRKSDERESKILNPTQADEFSKSAFTKHRDSKVVHNHRLLLSREDKPLTLQSKSGPKKEWYETSDTNTVTKIDDARFKNFHERCFKPVSQEYEVDTRVKRALDRLIRNCEKPLSEEKTEEKPSLNYKVIESKSSLENVIYFDRKDFEENGEENQPEGEKVASDSPKKVRFSDEAKGLKKCEDRCSAIQKTYLPDPSVTSIKISDWSAERSGETVELKKIEHELEDREEQLEASRAALENQQREINSVSREFQETERENARLRKSVDRIKDHLDSSINVAELGTSKDELLKKLIEVELDGATCGKQVAALRDVIARLRHENKMSSSDQALLSKERELLMQKMEDFDLSNRGLRRLLQSQHEVVADVKRLEEHRNTLIKKVADSDSSSLKIRSEMTYLKNELDQVLGQLSEEKNHSRTLTELNKSIDATRAHLQRELRAKEMENNRLHVQLRNMEKDTSCAQREAEEATAAARLSQDTIGVEKEALKKATRAQRQRADKAEQIVREIEIKLSEKENQLLNTREETDMWKTRYHRAMDDRARADTQVKSLSNKLDELEAMLRRNENKSRDREAELTEKLHRLTSESGTNELESERLKSDFKTTSEKLRMSQEDAAAQRAQVQQYETLNSELRAQLAKCKNEAEEALLGAERAEREARRMREQGSDEIERVRKQMLQRMNDLQPLPEILKETEMKLQDAQDQIHMHERRSAEQTRIISELTSKDEFHSDDTEVLRQRISALTDENRALEARLDIVHTKLNDRDVVLRDSAVQKADKDENIQTLQLKLEEKMHMCNSLQRQLDVALEEVRKTGEMERDKAAARERAAQARIADLETQTTRLKTDVASTKRTQIDAERRLQSQLQDARDRLEQSESTNRSMRNYVNFLKSSYSNVFGGDTTLTSTPLRGASGGATSPHSPY